MAAAALGEEEKGAEILENQDPRRWGGVPLGPGDFLSSLSPFLGAPGRAGMGLATVGVEAGGGEGGGEIGAVLPLILLGVAASSDWPLEPCGEEERRSDFTLCLHTFSVGRHALATRAGILGGTKEFRSRRAQEGGGGLANKVPFPLCIQLTSITCSILTGKLVVAGGKRAGKMRGGSRGVLYCCGLRSGSLGRCAVPLLQVRSGSDDENRRLGMDERDLVSQSVAAAGGAR
jgi:hypothetical protein